MKINTIKIILPVLLFATSILFSYDFTEVKSSFDDKEYSTTIELSNDFSIEESIDDDNYEDMLLYRGISFFHLKKFIQSKKLLNKFKKQFPYSKNKDFSNYYLAFIDLQNENYVEATMKFDNLISSSNKEISEVSEMILQKIVTTLISEEDNIELSEKIWDKKILDILTKKRDIIDILVVLPLSGSKSKKANHILNGIKYFLDINKLPGNKNINLDIVDSENNIAIMQRKVLDKLKTNNFDLIIGEFSRNSTSALSGIASLKKIPLIAPTAADNDISKISKYIFQLTPSSYTLGKKMAEYSIDSLGYKIFSTIAPVSLDGKESVDGFTDMVEEKGCLIFSSEYYYNAFNINKQLTRIREKVLNIDSLDLELYMSSDSLKKGTPVGIIDAFFLPIKTKDIESITPQIIFYNFEAKLIGSKDWNDIKELNKVKNNIDGFHFVTANNNDANNSLYNDFAYKFRTKNKRNPEELEILGYDAMYFLYLGIKSSLKENSALIDGLKSLNKYSGVKGNVVFEKENRSNSSYEIFKFNSRDKLPKKITFNKYKKQKNQSTKVIENEKLFNLGFVNYQVKNYELSLESFLRIKGKEFKSVNLFLAHNYFYLGDYENAEKDYQESMKDNPFEEDLFYNMALIKLSQENEFDKVKGEAFMGKAAELGKKEALIYMKRLEEE